MIGAADALDEPRGAFGRTHLDDEIDIAPIDAEIEAGGADERAQPARRDRRLDLASRLDREAAMVDADRERLLVRRPQFLEDELGEPARVAEDERRAVRLDLLHDLGGGPFAAMAGPGNAGVLGKHDADVWLGAGVALDDLDALGVAMRRKPALIGFGIGDRRGKADPAQLRRDPLEPGQGEGQQVAALGRGEGVDFVDDDGAQPFEQPRRVLVAQEQAERFGRGQQHLRRPRALARLALGRRVAGARLDPDRQAHLADRIDEVALDVDRQRLQRRDVERVEAVDRLLDQLDQARQEPRHRLAGARRRDEQRAAARPRGGEHLQLVPPRAPALRREPGGEN